MKCVVLHDFAYVSGGSSKCALLGAQLVAERGVDTTYIGIAGPADESFQHKNLKVVWPGKLHRPASAKRALEAAWHQPAVDAIKAALTGANPKDTVVHVHCWGQYLSAAPIHYAMENGFKVVASLHDYQIACPTGQFYDTPKNEVCRLTPMSAACICRKCTASKTMASKWSQVARHLVMTNRGHLPQAFRHIITFSAKSERVLKPFLHPDAELYRMAYPIRMEKRPRVDVRSKDTISFFGRISPDKNPLIFARVAKRMGVPARFIGAGPLEAAVKEVYPEAEVTGWQNGDQIAGFLDESRATILSSVWYEVNPLTPLEAIARGVPVIVSDITTTTDELPHDVSGLHFRMNDEASLEEQIRRMLDDDTVDRLGSTGYDLFWQNPPTPEAHGDRLVEVYERILHS